MYHFRFGDVTKFTVKMAWMYLMLVVALATGSYGLDNNVVYMHEDNNTKPLSLCPELSQCYCESKDGKHIIDCSNRELAQLPNFAVLAEKRYDTILLNNNKFSRILKGAFRGLNVKRMVISNNTLRLPSDNAFKDLDMLEELVMNNCTLTSTPVAFSSFVKLKHLELQNNGIEQINTKAFEEMVHLEYLDLSGNPITITAPFDGFRTLTKIKRLFMKNCGLHTIPNDAIGHMKKLVTLNLSKNKIWTIVSDVFSEMSELTTLDLSDNPIEFNSKEKVFGSLNKLQVLKLGGCKCQDRKLHKAVISNLKRLRILAIKSCDIHEMEPDVFNHLDDLKELNLGGNHFILKSEIFRGVTDTVEKLYLDDAGLNRFPYHIFEPFNRLRQVYVRDNQIKLLAAHDFQTLKKEGVHVYLQRNVIRQISTMALQWSPRPIHLHLQHNKLTNLSFIEKEPCRFQLVTMYLQGNNITCNCNVFKAVQMKAFTLVGKCSKPKEYHGLHLSWMPDTKKAKELFVEHNITSCNLAARHEERFECTCDKWMAWNTDDRCGVVGIADRPASFTISFFFTTLISLVVCALLR